MMHFEARMMHFEAKMNHFETKITRFESKMTHFEAKMKHFDPKPLKNEGFGAGATHLKITVPLGIKYTFDI